MLVTICIGGNEAGCVNVAFRLSPPKNVGSATLYFGTQYISPTILYLHYLARMFFTEQQQLRDYTSALPDVLSYVTSSVTSVTYVEPVPNASDLIDYRHLFEELGGSCMNLCITIALPNKRLILTEFCVLSLHIYYLKKYSLYLPLCFFSTPHPTDRLLHAHTGAATTGAFTAVTTSAVTGSRMQQRPPKCSMTSVLSQGGLCTCSCLILSGMQMRNLAYVHTQSCV